MVDEGPDEVDEDVAGKVASVYSSPREIIMGAA